MPSYSTPEAVAGFLKDFQMRINHQKKGTFSPAHVRYFLTISRYGKEFSTSFESNPAVYGEPTVTQVFSALASDALTMRSYGLDEFVDELCEGMKPSAALRAYNSCKETYDWMRDELYLSGSEIAEISDIPAWTVEGDDLAKVNDFLKKSCMEFSGSLPGDEKDEDGYSLTGEAKDATVSRDGLNGNQTRLEEKVAECREAATALANGDAL